MYQEHLGGATGTEMTVSPKTWQNCLFTVGPTNPTVGPTNLLYVIVDIDGSDVRINGMKGEYQSVTPDDIRLHDYRWNGVSIRPEASSYHKIQ